MFKIEMEDTGTGFNFKVLKISAQNKNEIIKEYKNLNEEQSVKLFQNFFDEGFTVKIATKNNPSK